MLVAVFILVYLSRKMNEPESVKINETQPISVINSCMRLLSGHTLQTDSKFPNDTDICLSLVCRLCKGIVYHSQVKPIYFVQIISYFCDILFNKHYLCSFYMLSPKWVFTHMCVTHMSYHSPVLVWFLFLYTECGADTVTNPAQSSIYLLGNFDLTALCVYILLHRGEQNCRIRLEDLTNFFFFFAKKQTFHPTKPLETFQTIV